MSFDEKFFKVTFITSAFLVSGWGGFQFFNENFSYSEISNENLNKRKISKKDNNLKTTPNGSHEEAHKLFTNRFEIKKEHEQYFNVKFKTSLKNTEEYDKNRINVFVIKTITTEAKTALQNILKSKFNKEISNVDSIAEMSFEVEFGINKLEKQEQHT